MATSWRVSENGMLWTFYLRNDVTFHDSTKFDAEAVVFNFNLWMDQDHPYRYGSFSYWSYKFGSYPGVIEKVEAIDKYIVQFTLTHPMAPFISNLAMPSFAIASPTAIAKYSPDLANNPVGTGPFKFDRWQDDEITLVANKDYWQGEPKLASIIFKTVTDNNERFEMLRTGKAHIIDGLDAQMIEKQRQDSNIRTIFRPSMNVGYLAMHNEKPYFDNIMVRQAINHAINKERIVQEALDGFAKPSKTVIPPSMWGHNHHLDDYEYNPAYAKALLAEAGYPYGFLTQLWVPPVARPYLPNPTGVAELISQDLRQIGIIVEIVSYDWPTYIQKVQLGEHPMALLGWVGDNGDPDNFIYVLLDKDNASVGTAANISFYKNDEVHDLLIEAQQETNQARRTQKYFEAQQIIRDEAPMVPLVHTTPPQGVSNKVRNYIPHPTGIDMLWQVEIID